MKNLAIVFGSLTAILIISWGCWILMGKDAKKAEVRTAVTEAMEDTINDLKIDQYQKLNNDKEFAEYFTEGVIKRMGSKMSANVLIYDIDYANGFLDAEVTAHYPYVRGQGKVTVRKTMYYDADSVKQKNSIDLSEEEESTTKQSDVVTTWSIGDGSPVVAALYKNGVLKIIATQSNSKTIDFTEDSTSGGGYVYAPWYKYLINNSKYKIKKIEIDKNITYLGDYAFYRTNDLKEIVINGKDVVLGKYVFESSGMESINLSNVKEIGDYCFKNCTKLEKVFYGENIPVMGKEVFFGCNHLKDNETISTTANRRE